MLAVATRHIRTDSRRGESFVVLGGEDGQFYAVRHEMPYFCFEADTIQDAVNKAGNAIESFYFTYIKPNEDQAVTR